MSFSATTHEVRPPNERANDRWRMIVGAMIVGAMIVGADQPRRRMVHPRRLVVGSQPIHRVSRRALRTLGA